MFWKINSENTKLEALLSKENVTLKEILSEEGIVNEVQSYNEKLLTFLLNENNLMEMLKILITTPDPDEHGIIYFGEQNIVSDILSSFVSNIYDTLSSKNMYLLLLFQPFLEVGESGSEIRSAVTVDGTGDTPNSTIAQSSSSSPHQALPPINTVTCSLILKVAKILSQQSSDKMLNFLVSTPNILDGFINQIENYSVTEFIMRCMQSFPLGEVHSNYFEWLSKEKLVVKLLQRISGDINTEPMCLKCLQTLVELLLSVRQAKEPNPLREDIETVAVVEHIVGVILSMDVTRTAVITAGFDFLKALFEVPERPINPMYGCLPILTRSKNTIRGSELLSRIRVFRPIIDSLVGHFPQFQFILNDNSSNVHIHTGYGGIISPPLGAHRLGLVDLLHQLVLLEQPWLYHKLLLCDLLSVLLRLLDQYFLNTFLHRLVVDMLTKLIQFGFSEPDSSTPPATSGPSIEPTSTVDMEESCSIEETRDICDRVISELFVRQDLLNKIMDARTNNTTLIESSNRRVRNIHWSFWRLVANAVDRHQSQLRTVVDTDIFQKWEKFSSTTLIEENKKNEPKRTTVHNFFDSSSEGEPANEVDDSEDLSKLYDECSQQKMVSEFPEYHYTPPRISSGSSNHGLNANPLVEMYISTPEDRENAENFESVCNVLLAPKIPKFQLHQQQRFVVEDVTSSGGGLFDKTALDLRDDVDPEAGDDDNIHDDEANEEDEDEEDEEDEDGFRTPRYLVRGSNSLPTTVIDEIFKEAYKEKSHSSSGGTTDGLSSGRFTFSTGCGIPSLSVGNVGSSSWQPKSQISILHQSQVASAGSSARSQVPPLNFASFKNSTNSVPISLENVVGMTTAGLSRCDEAEEELCEHSNDDDEEEDDGNEEQEPELNSSQSRFIDVGNDEDEDDDDRPLSSRLELEKNKMAMETSTVPTENLSNLDRQLDDKPWVNPSAAAAPGVDLDSELTHMTVLSLDLSGSTVNNEENEAVEQMDTVQDVTPDIEMVDSGKYEETPEKINLSRKDTDYTERQIYPAVTISIDNPFSPKLTRVELQNNPNSFQAINRSTSAPIKPLKNDSKITGSVSASASLASRTLSVESDTSDEDGSRKPVPESQQNLPNGNVPDLAADSREADNDEGSDIE